MAGEFLHDLGVHPVGRDDVMCHGPGFTRGPSKVTLEFRALTVVSCIPASIHVLSSMHNDVWWLEIQRPEQNLLIFSCNSLVGTRNRFGRYYDECRARGMRHNKALKAVARKRLGVIYAIMRDRVPYEEPDITAIVQNSHPEPLTKL